MAVENKLLKERKAVGCNGTNCNYQFQPLDVDEVEGRMTINRACMYCTFCTHTEDCYFNNTEIITKTLEEETDAVQES